MLLSISKFVVLVFCLLVTNTCFASDFISVGGVITSKNVITHVEFRPMFDSIDVYRNVRPFKMTARFGNVSDTEKAYKKLKKELLNDKH